MKPRFVIAFGVGLVLSLAFVRAHPDAIRHPPTSARQTCDQLLDQSFCHAAASVRLLAQHQPIGQAGPPVLPDQLMTPGTLDPAVRQANIVATICDATWLAAHEPGASWANAARRRRAARDLRGRDPDAFELDLLVPLSLGGEASDDRNLWLLPWMNGADAKDRVERVLHTEVCAGRLSLANAQTMIARDWIEAGSRFGIDAGTPRVAASGNRETVGQTLSGTRRQFREPVALSAVRIMPVSGEGVPYAVPAIPMDSNEF